MQTIGKAATERFSDRVQNYSRYRPSYPQAAIDWLAEEYRLSAESKIADIGSGTGIFSKLLVAHGLPVLAVEPNDEMRQESDRLLAANALYKSLPGKAEATLLETQSIDLITAAQSFHWFDQAKTKREFQRILKPYGVLALIWNRRQTTSDFNSEYEAALSQLPEYNLVNHTKLTDDDFVEFFGGVFKSVTFPYSQTFDLEGFRGRVFSSSYTPSQFDASHDAFSQTLDSLFARYSINDQLSFQYTTTVFAGSIQDRGHSKSKLV